MVGLQKYLFVEYTSAFESLIEAIAPDKFSLVIQVIVPCPSKCIILAHVSIELICVYDSIF